MADPAPRTPFDLLRGPEGARRVIEFREAARALALHPHPQAKKAGEYFLAGIGALFTALQGGDRAEVAAEHAGKLLLAAYDEWLGFVGASGQMVAESKTPLAPGRREAIDALVAFCRSLRLGIRNVAGEAEMNAAQERLTEAGKHLKRS